MPRRRFLLAAAACAVSVLSAVPGAPAANAFPGPVVTAMTFNIHHGVGTDTTLDLARIAAVVRANHVDLVALQEVDRHYSARSDWADQPAELARLLHYSVAFGANIDQDPPAAGRPRVQFGTAILSRYPIIGRHNTLLFRSPDMEQRGLLRADVLAPGGLLHVYDTHLEAYRTLDRAEQAKQIVGLVGDRRHAVLMGDLNATPDAPELGPLLGAFTDAWPVAGTGAELTYPAEAPVKRIDYVLTGTALRPVNCRVVATDPVASDHLPVACRIRVG